MCYTHDSNGEAKMKYFKISAWALFLLFGIGILQLNTAIADSLEGSRPGQASEQCQPLSIVSFNIQFLGNFKKRDNVALAGLLKDFDVVVVQELVAPPTDGIYPNGDAYTADPEAAVFFNTMANQGFKYLLSEEDTGTNDKIHKKSTSTEWWVSFYKPEKVDVAFDLPHGFLADDRSNNDDYERVPYAFPFRVADKSMDFVFISVHLQPGRSSSNKARRKHELVSISSWIDSHNSVEKDFIILGDMNIEDAAELFDAVPTGYISLNNEMRRTNTLINDNPDKGARPYDHVMYNIANTDNEIDTDFDLKVINLIEKMRPAWFSTDPYPGDPYNHNLFKQYYSDHHPVEFKMVSCTDDD